MGSELTKEDVLAKASALKFRTQAYIDGKFVDAVSGKTFDTENPATGQKLAEIAECTSDDGIDW